MNLSLPITGVGLVTAVGYGMVGSCAALRAGVSLPREIEMEVGEDGGDAAALATGFPAWPYADGFFQTGAWVRLGAGALEDLVHRVAPDGLEARNLWRSTSLVGALPLIAPDRFSWSLKELPDVPADCFLAPLAKQAAPGVVEHRQWDALGHASLAASLARARQDLDTQRVDRVAIVAADSYLDPLSLSSLHLAGRLKTSDRPTGLMPGEAGAAILVESALAARVRKAEILAMVDAVIVGEPPRPAARPAETRPGKRPATGDETEPEKRVPLRPTAALLGRALAEAVADVLPRTEQNHRFQGDLFLDLNGEDWRANAWGHAQVLLNKRIDLDRCRTFIPAESLGDTGAASAAISVALAAYNFMADGTESALILSMADDGRISVIRLGNPKR